MRHEYDLSFAPYVLPNGMPLALDALPDARWASLMVRCQLQGAAAAGYGSLRRRLPVSVRSGPAGRKLESLFRRLVPEAAGRLPTNGDAEFAYQRFAGINPLTIRRVRAVDDLPEKLRLSDELFSSVLGKGERFSSRLARGDLFIQSYDAVKVHSRRDLQPGKYVASGSVLFCYAPEKESPFEIIPVAIECPVQSADGATTVSTPLDGEQWRAAKKILDVADVHDSELRLHLARTHSMLVPFAMALRNRLPTSHALHELLLPHLRFNLFIDFLAWRQGVRDTGGILIRSLAGTSSWSQDVARSLHTENTFRELGFERDLAARGLDTHPVEYPYRDDGRLLWQAIHGFVESYVQRNYGSIEALRNDEPLHAFLAEAASPDCGNVRGLLAGQRLETREELSEILAQIIFVAGPLHALAHYSLAAHLQHVDENPAFLALNPLNKAGAPDLGQSRHQFTRVYGTYCQYDRLGEYGRFALGRRPELRESIREFQQELAAAEATIHARNAQRFAPFIHFLPSRISNGVTV